MLRAGVLTMVALVGLALGIMLVPSTSSGTANPASAAGAVVSGAAIAGDADCNGDVNSIDALLILQFDAGLMSTLPCQDAADVNKDGQTNSIDAALVLQYVSCVLVEPWLCN